MEPAPSHIMDSDNVTKNEPREESNTPTCSFTLTLSIVQLEVSIRQIDCPVTDTVTRVLDQLSCATPQDAVALLCSTQKDAPPSTLLLQRRSKEQCHTTTTMKLLRDEVEKSILRYIRDTDRWISFTSLLLKSLAWYRSLGHDHYNDNKLNDLPTTQYERAIILDTIDANEVLPIIDLPRTKHNRPYLPQYFDSNQDDDDKVSAVEPVHENRCNIMNISHQYPWVCMIQIQPQQQQQQQSKTLQSTNHLSLGIDVVIFHAPTNQYTPTIFDYISSFSYCFTPWEWERIINQRFLSSGLLGFTKRSILRRRTEQSMLREFYLRWSMKEAYTKAIGLGMNVNFHDFETRLCYIDDDDKMNNTRDGNDEEGIWTFINSGHMPSKFDNGERSTRLNHDKKRHQFSVTGRIRHANPTSSFSSSTAAAAASSSPWSEWEEWEFIFVPLDNKAVQNKDYDDDDDVLLHDRVVDDDHGLVLACACICIGPALSMKKSHCPSKVLPTTVGQGRLERCFIDCIESLSLLDLIDFHNNNSNKTS